MTTVTDKDFKHLQWQVGILAVVQCFLMLTLVIIMLSSHNMTRAWEGDDGGLSANEVDIGRWGAAVEAQAQRGQQMQLTTPPAPPTTLPPRPPHYDSWIRIAECESNGRWDINTGNGYYGGLQFSLSTWRAVGGTGYPHQNSMLEQMWRAERVLTAPGGGWGAWPVCSRYR